MSELSPSRSNTYCESNIVYHTLVAKHVIDMKSWNISVPPTMHELPSLYWLPKMHKDPYGSRFIAASNKCTTKPLSGLLTSCLSIVLTHFREYCDGISKNTGINCFWIVDNSQQVINILRDINTSAKAKHFDSYDFSTLYTSIPHGSLKANIQTLIEEAFKVRGASYISLSKSGKCYWAQAQNAYINIDRYKLGEMVEYLVDNIYVQVGNKVFRQCIGIPMGTDCAPLLANLYLFYYEFKYMRQMMRENFHLAKRFKNTVRYIDDLLTLNNLSFETEIANIYPPELILKKTTESETMVSYLDISITIVENKHVTAIYDKRDDFNFKVVNFSYLDSNIPEKPAFHN